MHLDEIPGLVGSAHDEWRGRLFGLNIRHVEQVGSLLAAPAGRVALERLGVPLDEVQHWLRPAIPQSLGLTLDDSRSACEQIQALLWNNERHPMGFAREELLPFRQAAFDSSLPEPRPLAVEGERMAAGVDLPSEHLVCAPRNFPAPKQGQRGTCVAFTVSAMYQLMRHRQGGEPVRLSVQHLYYLAKLECPLGFDEEGTSLDVALRVLVTQGCCLEQNLDYIPRHEIHQPHVVEGHKPHFSASKPGELAKSQRIGGFRHLPRSVATIKTELRQDRPVGVGVAVYDLAWYIAPVHTRGEVIMPPLDRNANPPKVLDTCLGGHAITLVGYKDNDPGDVASHRPGGGYFIFRNSWGEEWARQNHRA